MGEDLLQDTYNGESLRLYCDKLAKRDKRIKGILGEIGYPPFWHRDPGFKSLVMIILEQQVSLASAFSTYQKLETLLKEISPGRVLGMSDAQFKSCGFSRQKMSYVRGLAEELEAGRLDLDTLNNLDITSLRKELLNIKGIGNWTVDVYLLSCLHKLDVFPIGDLALIKSMIQAGFIKDSDSKESIQRRVMRYKPYRSIFTIILWFRYIKVNNIKIQFDL